MASLLLGAFEMLRTDGSTRVMAEGTSWGAPVPIEVAVNSFLQDGAVVVTQGHDNREVNVRVRFYGDDLTALNVKEAALFAELEKPNTLTWTPGGTAPATVFVVVTSSLTQQDESFVGEVQGDPWRTYNVRLVCAAFSRSTAEVTTAALAADGTTTTLVNDGSATTNWTGTYDGGASSPSVVSGAIKVTNGAPVYGSHTVSAILTTSITTSSTKYLQCDWKPEPTSVTTSDPSVSGVSSLRAYGDGVELARIAEQVSPTAGYIRSTFQVGAAVSSIAALRLDSVSKTPDSGGVSYDGTPATIRSLYVDNINRTDIKPSLGTARQLLRSVAVTGSARAQASLAVEHSTNALGDVLVYVYTDTAVGYVPPLRPYRVAGGAAVTADSALVSGSRDAINAATSTFDIPVSQIVPGRHLFMVRAATAAATATAATFTWTSSTRVGSTTVGSTETGTFTTTLPAGSVYAMLAMARINLPSVDASAGSATTVVRITLTASSTSGVNLDEAWLFNSAIGDLVGPVACGTSAAAAGGPARRLFIEPPSINTPRPRVLIGHSADRSDAFFPVGALSGWQIPQFTPPRVNVFTVTTNALDASGTLRHYPRWHTNPAS